jgi:hypothetical protein
MEVMEKGEDFFSFLLRGGLWPVSIDAQRSRLSGQMAAEALPQPGHDL